MAIVFPEICLEEERLCKDQNPETWQSILELFTAQELIFHFQYNDPLTFAALINSQALHLPSEVTRQGLAAAANTVFALIRIYHHGN